MRNKDEIYKNFKFYENNLKFVKKFDKKELYFELNVWNYVKIRQIEGLGVK